MIRITETKLWIAVKKNDLKLLPQHATAVCIVVTRNNDDELSLNLHLKGVGMVAYSDKYRTVFEKRLDLSELETLDVHTFIQKYPNGT